jgi:hypothetical protein
MKPILLVLAFFMFFLGLYFGLDWIGWASGDNKGFNLCALVAFGSSASLLAVGAQCRS